MSYFTFLPKSRPATWETTPKDKEIVNLIGFDPEAAEGEGQWMGIRSNGKIGWFMSDDLTLHASLDDVPPAVSE